MISQNQQGLLIEAKHQILKAIKHYLKIAQKISTARGKVANNKKKTKRVVQYVNSRLL